MKYKIMFQDDTVKEYDVTGRSGEPDVPFTLEFEVGHEDYTRFCHTDNDPHSNHECQRLGGHIVSSPTPRKRINIPLFHIKWVESEV